MSIGGPGNAISKDRYIEIKRIAYSYYEQYNKLDRRSRKSFLEALPELESQMETAILRNTLLFPDTEELLMTPKGKFKRTLNLIADNEDNITSKDVTYKSLEYGSQNIHKLIEQGQLKVMEGLKYPDHSVSEKEYLSLKRESLSYVREFFDCELAVKVKLIADCINETEYQQLIQVSTLLIPNDRVLMEQLSKASIEELANYYKVPVAVINFKVEEYNRQDTKELFEEGIMQPIKMSRLWYKSPIGDEALETIWDQNFYKEIEESQLSQANKLLSNMFSSFEKKATK